MKLFGMSGGQIAKLEAVAADSASTMAEPAAERPALAKFIPTQVLTGDPPLVKESMQWFELPSPMAAQVQVINPG